MATAMKFISMISATGRRPATAAPTAAPMIACSEIGVVRTRPVPYFVDSPAWHLNTPPPVSSAMSSPMTTHRRVLGHGQVEGLVDGSGQVSVSVAVRRVT